MRPGIASTSTTNPGVARSAGASWPGSTGRSLMVESSPLFWTRRARATTPALLNCRSGVSKNTTCRICARNGSMPRALIAARRSASATVIFSSTESDRLIVRHQLLEFLIREAFPSWRYLRHPRDPSISIFTRRLNSMAYSIGSSLVKTSRKPWTMRFCASFSVRPRLIR